MPISLSMCTLAMTLVEVYGPLSKNILFVMAPTDIVFAFALMQTFHSNSLVRWGSHMPWTGRLSFFGAVTKSREATDEPPGRKLVIDRFWSQHVRPFLARLLPRSFRVTSRMGK